MRGKADPAPVPVPDTGITPAHAGKSNSQSLRELAGQDHPRTCGEKVVPEGGDATWTGSPPHMRGKAVNHVVVQSDFGITPAHAGKR